MTARKSGKLKSLVNSGLFLSDPRLGADKLRSYGAAMRNIGNAGRQECEGRWINNRAENSYQPRRRRERAMLRFRRMGTLQKFVAVHGTFHNHFNQQGHLTSWDDYKRNRSTAFAEWKWLLARRRVS